jgi:hypothetical protein
MTRDGVGESGDVDSTDCSGRSWLESDEDPEFALAAFAAPARVVTISSPRESFENCSADMKPATLVYFEVVIVLWKAIYQPAQHRLLHATILADASNEQRGRKSAIIKGRLTSRPSVPCERWGVSRLWLSGE